MYVHARGKQALEEGTQFRVHCQDGKKLQFLEDKNVDENKKVVFPPPRDIPKKF